MTRWSLDTWPCGVYVGDAACGVDAVERLVNTNVNMGDLAVCGFHLREHLREHLLEPARFMLEAL